MHEKGGQHAEGNLDGQCCLRQVVLQNKHACGMRLYYPIARARGTVKPCTPIEFVALFDSIGLGDNVHSVQLVIPMNRERHNSIC